MWSETAVAITLDQVKSRVVVMTRSTLHHSKHRCKLGCRVILVTEKTLDRRGLTDLIVTLIVSTEMGTLETTMDPLLEPPVETRVPVH